MPWGGGLCRSPTCGKGGHCNSTPSHHGAFRAAYSASSRYVIRVVFSAKTCWGKFACPWW